MLGKMKLEILRGVLENGALRSPIEFSTLVGSRVVESESGFGGSYVFSWSRSQFSKLLESESVF